MPREIAATFDYRCPFARNGHEAVVNALHDGADVDFRFLAFSLDQAHIEEGAPPVWEREPSEWGTGTTALLYGIVVRDNFPEKFLDAHVELFAQRHDHGLKLDQEDVLEAAIERVGLDVEAVKAEVWSGRPLKTLAAEHTEAVERWSVFGVPTYCEGEEAVFIRFMERGRADDLLRALDLLDWTRLNEFKRTTIALSGTHRAPASGRYHPEAGSPARSILGGVGRERSDPVHVTARMSPSEAIMWAAEKDPALRSDFSNLTLLDGVPDVDRLRAKVEQALVSLPRLAERVVSPPLRIAPPEWRADPTLDIDYHLRRVALPEPGSMRNLLDVVATLTATPLDRSRPLWEFTLIEGLADGRAALLQRVHHTVTDGVGGLKLSLSLVDFERDPVPDVRDTVRALADEEEIRRRQDLLEDPLERDSPIGVLRDALGFAWQRNLAFVRRGLATGAGIALHPTSVPRRAEDAFGMVASMRRQVLVAGGAKSSLLATRSLGRRYDVLTIDLEEARAAGHALGGSINDVFVTGVAGALGLYHERHGIPVEELRMAMAVSTRSGDDSTGNQFVPTRVVVPIAPKEPAERFNRVRAKITNVRHEPALAAADSFAGLAAGLPTSVIVGALRSQTRSVDFATSNLSGSPIELYLGGAEIVASYPMGPRSGCAVNVTALSYLGDLNLGIHSDPAAITDPDALVECLQESFDALLAAGV